MSYSIMFSQSNVEKTAIGILNTPQSFIHIEHKMTLLQYKYWILLLWEWTAQVGADMPAEGEWRYMRMQTVESALGYKPNKYQLYSDLEALKNLTAVYNLFQKDGRAMGVSQGLISKWSVSNHRIGFILPTRVTKILRDVTRTASNLTFLNWDVFCNFSGKHEAVLYKLCYDYRHVHCTPYMTIDQFRKYMGIGANEYKAFRDFNRSVITGPIARINESELSDLKIRVVYTRLGRTVTGLQFFIEAERNITAKLQESAPQEQNADQKPEDNCTVKSALV
jgi:hypothetical protein